MIGRILSMIPAVPQALLLRAAAIFLFGSVCYVAGNLHATERSLERRERDGERRMVEYHGQMVSYYAERMKELRLAREQQEGAANAAYDILQRGKANADRAYRTAMSDIAKLRNENATLAADKSDPGCTMAPRMRDILDTAIERINLPSVSGSNAGQAPAVPPRPYTTAPILTCGQLQRGFLNVLRAYGELKADVEAEVERQSRVQ